MDELLDRPQTFSKTLRCHQWTEVQCNEYNPGTSGKLSASPSFRS
jgi:hypothetical protein